METSVQKPSGWAQGRPTRQDQTIELTFAVKQTGKQALYEALIAVNNKFYFAFHHQFFSDGQRSYSSKTLLVVSVGRPPTRRHSH